MDVTLFPRGIAIGLAVAAPIGPVGILCIRKALADGRLAALAAGMGATLADTAFGAAIGLGLGAVTAMLNSYATVLTATGGLFLLALGVRSWRGAAFALEPATAPGPGMARDVAATFVITLTNPGTLFGVMGVFAALGASARPSGPAESALLVAGIFVGSTLWWLILAELTILARARFTPAAIHRLNHLSGALLILFGAAALASLAWGSTPPPPPGPG